MSIDPVPASFARAAEKDCVTPLLTRDAAAHGLTPSLLRRKAYRRVFHGVHLPVDAADDTWTRAHAALALTGQGAVASFTTAARLWGAAVPEDADIHVSVATAAERRAVEGITFHVDQGLVPEHHVRGVRVTSPEHTFIDLARRLSLVDLVVVGDGLVRNGHTTPEMLRTACLASRRKGSVAARRASMYVRTGVESPMETRLRMLVILAGLPEPELQIEIRLEDGTVVYRLDMGYVAALLGFEYDGRHHAEDPEQWDHDVSRREYLDSIGWRIIVIRAADIYQHPDQTLARIVTAMKAAGAPVPALSTTWARHFPGRSS
ncbi:DUF559 domain-containing protein [Oceanitalea stevensii]|uniref:DUF559 domain-containing protein n=1 Tax=Oceanitalea stevensii TaxID=2763072 RepID=A0ABR8Z136_9MICO|nr:DUF559 domain-containing protein [Oceanitalea stevensii]MBD8061753.1 DUF559 domain-containing protein [Oceanitalea stevensii]